MVKSSQCSNGWLHAMNTFALMPGVLQRVCQKSALTGKKFLTN
jgi:hypothetical protein